MTVEKILVYLVLLSVLILLHEYGHFFVARRNGVYVTDFALGMGPTLLKWTSKRSGTNYRLNVLPIGGYCQMKGEDGQTNEAEQQRAFRAAGTYDADNLQGKTPLQRLAIVLAGPIMNFIVALVLFFVAAVAFGVPTGATTTQIGQILPGSPASKIGLQVGDRIASVNGVAMHDGDQLVTAIHSDAGRPVHLQVLRDGRTLRFDVTPISAQAIIVGPLAPTAPAARAGLRPGNVITAIDGVKMNSGDQIAAYLAGTHASSLRVDVQSSVKNPASATLVLQPAVIAGLREGRIGFGPADEPQRIGPVDAARTSWNAFSTVSTSTLGALGGLFTHPKETASQFSGPIGIATATSQAASLGWYAFLFLAGVISISLGIFNLLPVPALDGGRAVFILVEMLRGKPVDPEKEALVHVGGFAVLIALMLVVSFHDISNSLAGHAGL
jgi:regulator of sigma E protease